MFLMRTEGISFGGCTGTAADASEFRQTTDGHDEGRRATMSEEKCKLAHILNQPKHIAYGSSSESETPVAFWAQEQESKRSLRHSKSVS